MSFDMVSHSTFWEEEGGEEAAGITGVDDVALQARIPRTDA